MELNGKVIEVDAYTGNTEWIRDTKYQPTTKIRPSAASLRI
jgi:hypothetical protein